MYPPFTVLARLLAESADEVKASDAVDMLEKKVREMLDVHPEWQRKVITLLKDTPSVKFLKGKHRKHILIKALACRETDAFFGALTELSSEATEGAEIWFEINPNTMM